MRVALLNQFYAPDISPTAQLAASLAEHRAAQGDTVTVITGRAGYLEGLGGSLRTDEGAASVRVRRVWTPDLGKSSAARRLLGYVTYLLGAATRVLALPRQDVVIAMTTPPFVVIVALLHRVVHRRTRVILWSMDCYPDAAERFEELRAGGLASRALRSVNRFAFRRIDHLIALDGAMAELLLSQYAAGPDRPTSSIVPNWERQSLFPSVDAGPAWPGWDDLPIAGRTVVVYLGNTGVGHRFDTVLDVADRIGEEVVFVFIGGGARRAELEQAVELRGLGGSVLFLDYVPKEQTGAVMAGADAALITLDERSLGVMSPSKLHSNLAAGLPVLYVGPAGSNVDEAISRFGCGASLREGDVDGAIAFLRALVAPEAAAMRTRARHAFDDAYCDVAVLPRFDAILDA